MKEPRASCAQAKCTTQTIRGISFQSPVPMATATAGVIVGKVMFLITCDMQRLSPSSEAEETRL